jgi:hypothetical protein
MIDFEDFRDKKDILKKDAKKMAKHYEAATGTKIKDCFCTLPSRKLFRDFFFKWMDEQNKSDEQE